MRIKEKKNSRTFFFTTAKKYNIYKEEKNKIVKKEGISEKDFSQETEEGELVESEIKKRG